VLTTLAVVTHAQLPHYAPIPVEHHIEEYHHVGTSNDEIRDINFK
jgi:hypothetical protein